MRFQHMQSWFQVRQGKLLCSRYDYIFGLDLGLFETLIIRDLFFFIIPLCPPLADATAAYLAP